MKRLENGYNVFVFYYGTMSGFNKSGLFETVNSVRRLEVKLFCKPMVTYIGDRKKIYQL